MFLKPLPLIAYGLVGVFTIILWRGIQDLEKDESHE